MAPWPWDRAYANRPVCQAQSVHQSITDHERLRETLGSSGSSEEPTKVGTGLKQEGAANTPAFATPSLVE